jgi:hypothetical protein
MLDEVVRDIESSLKKQKGWHGTIASAKDEGDRINEATRKMNEAFDNFTVSPTT